MLTQEQRILALHEAGMSQRLIAATTGYGLRTVRRVLDTETDGSNARLARILRHFDRGLDPDDIAPLIGISVAAVRRTLRRNGVTPPPTPAGPPRAPVEEYRLRLAIGVPVPEILAHLGGSLGYIEQLSKRRLIDPAVAWGRAEPTTRPERAVSALRDRLVEHLRGCPDVGDEVVARQLAVSPSWVRYWRSGDAASPSGRA